jgi:hypothetical protein
MISKTYLPCLLLWLTRAAFGQEVNGWTLKEACMPTGQVSKAYFHYANNTESTSITLTADWGNGTTPEVVTVEMGGASGKTNYEFTHTHTTPGTIQTSFVADGGVGKVTVPQVCNITAGAGTPTTSASSNAIFSRNVVALAAVALSYLSIQLSL